MKRRVRIFLPPYKRCQCRTRIPSTKSTDMLGHLLSLYTCISLLFKTWIKEELLPFIFKLPVRHQGKWHSEEHLVLQKTYLSYHLMHWVGWSGRTKTIFNPFETGHTWRQECKIQRMRKIIYHQQICHHTLQRTECYGLQSRLPGLWVHLLIVIGDDNGNKHLKHYIDFFIDHTHGVKCLQ